MPHASQLIFRKLPGKRFAELLRRPARAARLLPKKPANDTLYLARFRRQRTPGAFACRIVEIPAFTQQPKEAAAIAQHALYGEMCQIVQRKVSRMALRLLLPRNGTVIANTAQHPRAVFPFRNLNAHGYFRNARSTGAPLDTVSPVAVMAPVFWSTLKITMLFES